MRGYSAFASESLSWNTEIKTPRDLNESFVIGPLKSQGRTDRSPENIWPAFNESFKTVWENYYSEMENISANLLDIFSDCLNIPYDFFIKNTSQHTSLMRARFYPLMTSPPEVNQFRVGPHTDFGSFSITLEQTGTKRMDFFNTERKNWVPVAPIEGHFILNLGDLFARLTNDFWKAPVRRVVALDDGSKQLSVIFLHSFNHDTLVKSFDSFATSSYPSKYPPVTTAEHIALKMKPGLNY